MIGDPAALFHDTAQHQCHDVADRVLDEVHVLIARHFPPASPPGLPPAMRSGDLDAGYHVEDTADGAEIRTPVDYWKYLEYGTSKMAARPHLRPAVEFIRALNGNP